MKFTRADWHIIRSAFGDWVDRALTFLLVVAGLLAVCAGGSEWPW